MADIFISYVRDEREKVSQLASALEALGLTIFFDARIPTGSTFDEVVNHELSEAKAVLVCWTPPAVASRWVRSEASIGLQRDVLAAAFLKASDLPAPFNLVQTEDISDWHGGYDHPGFKKLLHRLGALVGRPRLSEEAFAKALEADWVERDRAARSQFDTLLVEARTLFEAAQSVRPADFERRLSGVRGEFEGWLLTRRTGDAGPAPDPRNAAEEAVEALRADLEAAKRERDATTAMLSRLQQDTAATAAQSSMLASDQRDFAPPKSYIGALWRALTVLFTGPIALTLWGMRRLCAIWTLMFAVTFGVVALQGCSPAAELASDPDASLCYDLAARTWRTNPNTSSSGSPTPALPSLLETIPTDEAFRSRYSWDYPPAPQAGVLPTTDSCQYVVGYARGNAKGVERGQHQGFIEGKTSLAGMALGFAFLYNFGASLIVLSLGVGQVAKVRKLSKIKAS